MTNTEGVLRKELWLRHGHQGLYGDDGEMQCQQCGLDYKRDSAEKIAARLLALDYLKDLRQLHAMEGQTVGDILHEDGWDDGRKEP